MNQTQALFTCRAALVLSGACLLICASVHASAAAPEHWSATSDTAMSITGDVTFAPDKITFQSGKALLLEKAGQDADFEDSGDKQNATIFRVTVPDDPLLKNGNRLCGSGDHPAPVTFIAIWTTKPLPGEKSPRTMAAFSGPKPPHASGGRGACGTFYYDAGG